MKKRLALIWTPLVLVLALMLPATAAASGGYGYKTVYNYCYGNQVNLRMKAKAAGYTNANKLSIESWAQRKVGSHWQTVYHWNKVVYRFYIDGRNHSLTSYRSYNGNNSYLFRIIFRLRAWHGKHLLASSSFHSVRC